jgi:hypothetical protein
MWKIIQRGEPIFKRKSCRNLSVRTYGEPKLEIFGLKKITKVANISFRPFLIIDVCLLYLSACYTCLPVIPACLLYMSACYTCLPIIHVCLLYLSACYTCQPLIPVCLLPSYLISVLTLRGFDGLYIIKNIIICL